MSSQLMTLEECSKFLSVSRKTIYYWVSRSEIPFVRVGRHLRFQPETLVRFFETKTAESRFPCRSSGDLIENNPRSLTIRSVGSASSKKGG